jgi:hypothetical protein
MSGQGISTDVYRAYLAEIAGTAVSGVIEDLEFSFFRFGEGGWETDPETGLRVPSTPDAARTDIVATGPAEFGGNELLRFEGSLTASAVNQAGLGIVTVSCVIPPFEPTVDEQGLLEPPIPRFYELGIFNGVSGVDERMVAYLTFDERLKRSGKGFAVLVPFSY